MSTSESGTIITEAPAKMPGSREGMLDRTEVVHLPQFEHLPIVIRGTRLPEFEILTLPLQQNGGRQFIGSFPLSQANMMLLNWRQLPEDAGTLENPTSDGQKYPDFGIHLKHRDLIFYPQYVGEKPITLVMVDLRPEIYPDGILGGAVKNECYGKRMEVDFIPGTPAIVTIPQGVAHIFFGLTGRTGLNLAQYYVPLPWTEKPRVEIKKNGVTYYQDHILFKKSGHRSVAPFSHLLDVYNLPAAFFQEHTLDDYPEVYPAQLRVPAFMVDWLDKAAKDARKAIMDVALNFPTNGMLVAVRSGDLLDRVYNGATDEQTLRELRNIDFGVERHHVADIIISDLDDKVKVVVWEANRDYLNGGTLATIIEAAPAEEGSNETLEQIVAEAWKILKERLPAVEHPDFYIRIFSKSSNLELAMEAFTLVKPVLETLPQDRLAGMTAVTVCREVKKELRQLLN